MKKKVLGVMALTMMLMCVSALTMLAYAEASNDTIEIVFYPSGGTYKVDDLPLSPEGVPILDLILFTTDEGWLICYTTDGSEPILFDKPQGEGNCNPVTVTTSESINLKAVAYRLKTGSDGTEYEFGQVFNQIYNIIPVGSFTSNDVTFSKPGGSYVVDDEEGIDIKVLTGPGYRLQKQYKRETDKSTTITVEKYRINQDGFLEFVCSATQIYNIITTGTANVPSASNPIVFSPPGGIYSDEQTVTMTCEDGWKICYRTDGKEPISKNNTPYGYGNDNPVTITISNDTDIKAVAYKLDSGGRHFSDVVSQTYSFREPSYNLSVTSPTFQAVTVGYTQPEARKIDIANISYSNATVSSVSLSGDGANCFELNKADGVAIAAGTVDNTSYTVQPKAGLAEGTYTATITVTYDGGATATDDVSFIVKPQQTCTLTVTAPKLEAEVTGYTQTAAMPLTIANSGNSAATITSVTLDGPSANCFILNTTGGTTIPAGSTDSATYTVQPNAGLNNGEYYATVNVQYNNGKTATASLNFAVREFRINLIESPYGNIFIPSVADRGDEVRYYVAIKNEYWDEYRCTDVEITAEDGEPVEMDGYAELFIMPASNVTVQPVIKHLNRITFNMDEHIQIMMVQSDTGSRSADNAAAPEGETVWFDPLCGDDRYQLGTVTVKTENGDPVTCNWYVEPHDDFTETGYRFVMPDEPVTVRITQEQTIPIFEGYDLTLNDTLDFRYYVSMPTNFDSTGAAMTFSVGGRSMTVNCPEIDNGIAMFTCPVYAYEMGDSITATLSYGDGKSVENTYSVAKYLTALMDLFYGEKEKNLAGAALTYGKYMMTYLANFHSWDNTAHTAPEWDGTPDVSAAQTAVASGFAPTVTKYDGDKISGVQFNLNPKEATRLNFVITLKDGVTGTVTAGEGLTLKSLGNNQYRITKTGIGASNLGTEYDFVLNVDGSPVFSAKASVMTYVKAVLGAPQDKNEENAMAALYQYYVQAVNY